MSSHRTHISSLTLWFGLALASVGISTARAEEKAGTAAQLLREASLRKAPSESAESLGRLPKGTVLTYQGQEKNGFVSVDVELEDGSTEGWVPKDAVNKVGKDDDDGDGKKKKGDDDDDEADEQTVVRPRRVKVPKDEGLLLRRDPFFFYGLQALVGGSFIADDQGTSYTGLAYGGGAHMGVYFDRSINARLDVGYIQLTGSGSSSSSAGTGTGTGTGTTPVTGNLNLQFAFIEIGGVLSYLIDNFELSAGLQYSYGISLSDLPNGGKVDSASDLSNLGVSGGLGYRIQLSEITDLWLRARYVYTFLTSPLNFQHATAIIALSFRG